MDKTTPKKGKINIGLDMGIGSVGWAVVNADHFEIIDAGIRLFPEAAKEASNSAASRREKRSSRRMHRRARLRLDTLKELFVEFNLLDNVVDFDKLKNDDFPSMAALKNYALNNQITAEQMMLILYHSLKKRGSFNIKEDLLDDIVQENKANGIELTTDELNLKVEELSKKLPSEFQLENFEKNGIIKGSDNRFPHEGFKKEIQQIFDKQNELGFLTLSEEFQAKYFEIFDRKRQYWEGPNKQSKFSWQVPGNPDETQQNFYSRLIGMDTFNRDKPRTAKKGMYAALFNLLNDLNNLTISDEPNRTQNKLTKLEKEKIISWLFEHPKDKSRNLTLRELAKLLVCDSDHIRGYRIEGTGKSEKATFTKFDGLNDIFKTLKKANLDVNWLVYDNLDLIDEVIVALTKSQDVEGAQRSLEKLYDANKFSSSPTAWNQIAKELAILSPTYSGSHALSLETIKLVLNDMLEKPLNSQEVFKEMGIKKQYKFDFSPNEKYIPVLADEINNLFISPVVKRTLIQTLKVLREIQIEFQDYEIETIAIELAREKNSDDEKKYIKFIQEMNKKSNDEIIRFLGVDSIDQVPRNALIKLSLLMEQDNKCVYCGQELDPWKVVNYPDDYEVDHIIPESISFNSKRENLVLVHNSENNAKGNMTTYQYMNSSKSKIRYGAFVVLINEIYSKRIAANPNSAKQLRQKIYYLTTDFDFSDEKNSKPKFVNRNLVDTRYATTEVYNYLEDLKNKLVNNPLNNVKLKVLNGSYTDWIKKQIFQLPHKNRDDFRHHGIDAITIAYADDIKQEFAKLNKEFGAKDALAVAQTKYGYFGPKILDFPYHFSRKTNQNFNRQLSNDTLYSFKKHDGEFHQMMKVKLTTINKGEIEVLNKIFDANAKKHLDSPLEVYDSKTFAYLQTIYQNYPIGKPYMAKRFDRKTNKFYEKETKIINPFLYFIEHEGNKIYLQKNTKNPEKNPEIKFIRYYGNKMGRVLDVTEKYSANQNKVKIGFTSLKPIRLDLYRSKHTGLYKIFPVNAKLTKKITDKLIEIDDSSYYKSLKDNKIYLEDYEKVLELFPRGTTIRVTSKNGKYINQLFEVVGSPNDGIIEVDYIEHKKTKDDPIQIVLSVSQLSLIEKVHVNILGTKRKYIQKDSFDSNNSSNSIAFVNEEQYNKSV